jgi:hypothetical protein
VSERGFLTVTELVLADGAPASDQVVEDAFVAYFLALDEAQAQFRRAVLAPGRWECSTQIDFRPLDNAASRALLGPAKARIALAAAERPRENDELFQTRDDLDRSGPGIPSPFRRRP